MSENEIVQHMNSGFNKVQVPTNLTGYEMHKIVNLALRNAGLTKQIPPQMMYNYLGKGYVTRETFGAWLDKYITKQLRSA